VSDAAVTEAREAIDAIDRSLVTAVNRRLELVRKLHEHKRSTGTVRKRGSPMKRARSAKLAWIARATT